MRQDYMFDQAAVSYDRDFTFSNIGKAQRQQVRDFFEKHFSSAGSLDVLEINCGTGEDALWLSSKGYHVTATDASAQMINICLSKRSTGNLHFRQCSFGELNSAFRERKFDLVFSNFGGLNCITAEELQKLSNDLSELLSANGKLFMVVMGDQCMMENLYFFAKGKKLWKRSSSVPLDVRVAGQSVRTYYYSPKILKKIFSGRFKLIDCKPVGLFVPPSYMEAFFLSHMPVFRFLKKMDRIFRYRSLSRFGDHYAVVLEKQSI